MGNEFEYDFPNQTTPFKMADKISRDIVRLQGLYPSSYMYKMS